MDPARPIMEISLPLEKFADQIVKNETLRLQYAMGGSGNVSPGTLNCSLHWLYSRGKFYTNIIDMLDRELKRDTEAKKDSEENLRALYSLFPATNEHMPKQINFASVARFNDFSPMVSKTEPTLGQATKGNSPWARPIMYLCYFLILAAILACFLKPQFLDVALFYSVMPGLHLHYICTQQCAKDDLQDGDNLHCNSCAQHRSRHHLVGVLPLSTNVLTPSLGGALSTLTLIH